MAKANHIPNAVATRATQERKALPNSSPQEAEISADRLEEILDGLTPRQKAKVDQVGINRRDRAAGPSLKLKMADGTLEVRYSGGHRDAASLLMMADMASCDPAFQEAICGQVASIGANGRQVDEANTNFLLSVVRAVQPRDELETMLAVQMGAIHAATMMMARRLNHVETIPQQDAAERALNKLSRTYAMQMETLKRYRTGGQQKVIVEHVTVNAGGQAIVGSVATGGRGSNERRRQPHTP